MPKMLKSGPILILCHWHTGSSVIAKILAACGMQVGNSKTLWDKDCEAQCEHSILNRIGDQLTLGILETGYASVISDVLKDYSAQAKKLKWKHYGVKATHCLHKEAFPIFAPVFKKVWPKARILIILRHPADIVASTNDPDWDENRILESIRSTYEATEKLIKQGAIPIVFPDGIHDFWKLIPKLGMKVTTKAKNLFDPNKIEIIDKKYRAAFAEAHADDVTWFERITS